MKWDASAPVAVLQVTTFDAMENSTWQARETTIVGALVGDDAEMTAIAWIADEKTKRKPYQGWDGKTYPEFTYTMTRVAVPA